MSRDNLKGKFLGEILNYELKQHDWTYEMSDDHNVYLKGTEHRKKIKQLVKDAYKLGLDPADYFYKFYPVDGCHPHEGYGIKKSWQQVMDKKAKEMK
jgi:ferritin-like protein|tara:strand:- start:1442 stop:1732 length:291 start_codon:yes stop_codon:yes gene_type:complete